ncbi:RNA methyltransferase [Kriegella sp. EG-1]|nr:RNA methyltransferase [Flavobacteriaceae bacterium EG-1]
MAYDEFLADRARRYLNQKSVCFTEKKMIGGLCFMVNDKMCFGMHIDKNTDSSLLMARIGIDKYEEALTKPHCSEMNFTGRSMKGYVFVSAEGIDTDKELEFWLQLCLDYNPLAKKSKKRIPKKK